MATQSRKHPGRGARRFLVGPGTISALLLAFGLAAFGWLSERDRPTLNAGRIVFEADAHGRMRRVDAPTPLQTTQPPLWKPEPVFLLKHATELRLQAGQMRRVKALDAAWHRDRAALEQAMERATAGTADPASAGRGVFMTQLQQSLADYSDLSRAYDARRAGYWARATVLLTDRQRRTLNRIAPVPSEARN